MTEHKEHSHVHKEHTHKKIKKSQLWQMVSAILGLLFIISIFTAGFRGSGGEGILDGLSADEAADKAISFINSNVLREGQTASLGDIESESQLYKMMITIDGQEFASYVTKDGKLLFPNAIDMEQEIEVPEQVEEQQRQPNKPENEKIKTFLDSEEEVCYEDGKPVIRMYASSGCGYCRWNKPIFEKVAREYMDEGKVIAYLWEDGKNILSDEQEEATSCTRKGGG